MERSWAELLFNQSFLLLKSFSSPRYSLRIDWMNLKLYSKLSILVLIWRISWNTFGEWVKYFTISGQATNCFLFRSRSSDDLRLSFLKEPRSEQKSYVDFRITPDGFLTIWRSLRWFNYRLFNAVWILSLVER